MELSKLKVSNKYVLRVSDVQISRIKSTFVELHDWQGASRQDLNIQNVLSRMERMREGYLSSYRLAENIGGLRQRIEQWCVACCDRIYGSLFGKDKVAALSLEQCKFLGLPAKRVT